MYEKIEKVERQVLFSIFYFEVTVVEVDVTKGVFFLNLHKWKLMRVLVPVSFCLDQLDFMVLLREILTENLNNF
jgi:hypothetical protein